MVTNVISNTTVVQAPLVVPLKDGGKIELGPNGLNLTSGNNTHPSLTIDANGISSFDQQGTLKTQVSSGNGELQTFKSPYESPAVTAVTAVTSGNNVTFSAISDSPANKAEFRAIFYPGVSIVEEVDLRTVQEGGTFQDNGTTELHVGCLTCSGTEVSHTLATETVGRWFFVWRMKNEYGWSNWSDGNPTPSNVKTFINLTAWDGSAWASYRNDAPLFGQVNGATQIIPGSIDTASFATTITAPTVVSTLPAPGNQGRLVFLTTDNKLYRDTGTAWTVAVPTTDLTGTIINAQIAANAVAEIQLAANAVTEGKIAANAVVADKIAANAIGANHIAANSVIAGKIAANAIGANELQANSVVAGKIAANAVGANEIIANSITAGQIAASAIGADEIAANAVTTVKLAAKAATISKLAVVPDNICPDSAFQDESAWVMQEGWSFLVNDGSNLAHQMGVPKCAMISSTSRTYSYHAYDVPSFAGVGQTLRLRYKAYNDSNQTMYAGVSFKNVAGADISLIFDTLAPGSGHKLVSKQGVVPAGTVKLSFWARTNGAGLSGTMAIGEWKLDVATSADLIVDGSILTQHLGANQVTAAKIFTTTLSALAVDIGSVTAGTITGATFRTTSDNNGNYIEISGNTFKGKNAGNVTVWEMFPGQGPLFMTDSNNNNFQATISANYFDNYSNYGGIVDTSGLPNTPEGMNAAIALAMNNYAANGVKPSAVGKWDVTALLPTMPRSVLIATTATVATGNKAEIIVGPVGTSANWNPAGLGQWEITYTKPASAVRTGILGNITDTRLTIVPTQKIGNNLYIQRTYTGSLTGVSFGTVRILGAFP